MSTQIDQRPAERRPEPEERRPVAGVVVVLVVLAALLLVSLYVQRSRTETNRRLMTPDASPAAMVPTTPVPPALVNTGDNPDWGALVRSIMAYDFWLKVHPDPALVPTIYAPDYRAVLPSGEVMTLASVQADTATLARGDLRYDPAPVETTAAIVTIQNRDATSASVFVRFNPRPGYRTVGRDGTVTQLPDEKGGAVIWRLVLGTDGRWRLAGWKLP